MICSLNPFRTGAQRLLLLSRRTMTLSDVPSGSPRLLPSLLDPPTSVRGMKLLDRTLFDKRIQVPCLRLGVHVQPTAIERLLKSLKRFLLRMDNLKAVRHAAASDPDPDPNQGHGKVVLLNPVLVHNVQDLSEDARRIMRDIELDGLEFRDLDLTYANFKSEQVLNAVLPDAVEGTTSYSRVGHIVHVNLREHLDEYRHLIGQVLLDKLTGVTCVVNKTDAIETEFRNFKMEVLAGDGASMTTRVRENGCEYEFDFGRVFWNPRLSSEHERLAALLPDVGHVVLYDVFAGVGPFAVPAARRRKCRVLANDLNPDSFRWLQHNVRLNKVVDRVTCHNLDGRDFIRDVVGPDMVACWTGTCGSYVDPDVVPEMHVSMNLPALAVTFLDAFRGLLAGSKTVLERASSPTIHCYTFVRTVDVPSDADRGSYDAVVVARLKETLGHEPDPSTTRVTFVRKVAPNKDMVRVTFRLPMAVLYDEIVRDPDETEPNRKRTRTDC